MFDELNRHLFPFFKSPIFDQKVHFKNNKFMTKKQGNQIFPFHTWCPQILILFNQESNRIDLINIFNY